MQNFKIFHHKFGLGYNRLLKTYLVPCEKFGHEHICMAYTKHKGYWNVSICKKYKKSWGESEYHNSYDPPNELINKITLNN